MNICNVLLLFDGFSAFTYKESYANIFQYLIQLFGIIFILFSIYYLIHIGNQFVVDNKKLDIRKKHIFYFLIAIIIAVLFFIIISYRQFLYEILSPFIFAAAFAYILNPLVKYLVYKGIKRLWAVLIIYFVIFLIIFLFSVTLIPRISSEVKKLIEIMPKYSIEMYGYFYNLYLVFHRNLDSLPVGLEGIKDFIEINIQRIQEGIFGFLHSVTNAIINLFSKVIGIILVPILTFYFLNDAEKLKKSIILLIPGPFRTNVLNIAKDIDAVLGGFIRGQLIVASFVGIMTGVSLLILGVEFAVLVGLIAGIANIVPYFGPIAGIVPGIIFAFLDSPLKALSVIIVFTIIQQIESGIIAPKIVGKTVGVHPVIVIFALIIGGKLLGIIGLLIAVPLAGVIKVLCRHLISYIAKL